MKTKKLKYFKDWNMWCCVFEDFINLQKNKAWFWKTKEEAKNNLLRNTTIKIYNDVDNKETLLFTTEIDWELLEEWRRYQYSIWPEYDVDECFDIACELWYCEMSWGHFNDMINYITK